MGGSRQGDQRQAGRGRGRGQAEVGAPTGQGPSPSPQQQRNDKRMQKTEFGWGPSEEKEKEAKDLEKEKGTLARPEPPWKKKSEGAPPPTTVDKDKILAEIEAERRRLRDERDQERIDQERLEKEKLEKLSLERQKAKEVEQAKEAAAAAAIKAAAPLAAAYNVPSPVPVVAAVSLADAPLPEKCWLYKDPKGIERGPFSSGEMDKWMRHDYFKIDLLVRRIDDPTFAPLYQLFLRVNANPFTLVPLQQWFSSITTPNEFQKSLYLVRLAQHIIIMASVLCSFLS